jgi:dihydrofolate reductase
VLTHFAREPLPMQGGTTFFFVTDGINSALEQARRAANGKDVALGGGANIAQQYLASGLIDELEIHVVPILLGRGARVFDNVNFRNMKLEPISTIAGAAVTHLKYRVLK